MLKRNYLKIFIIVMIFILAVGAVSAFEDVNGTVEADVLAGSEDAIDDEIAMSNEEDVLGGTGTFSNLQDLVNNLDDNETLILDEDISYSPDSDSITEGVEITKNNITIDGNGFVIDALNQSRIFKILGNGTRFVNITFANANNSALWYENVSSSVIENSRFINNHATEGTIHFTGGDLTISDVEFINSSTINRLYDENGYYYNNVYSGTAILYANATGNIVISRTNFTGSRFKDNGITIVNASDIVFSDVEFSDNLALDIVYDFNETSKEYYAYMINIGNFYSSVPSSLICVDSDNFEMINTALRNNTVAIGADLSVFNATIKNWNVSDSTFECSLDMLVKENAEFENIVLDNISTAFYNYYWDSVLNDYTYSVSSYGEELMSVRNRVWNTYVVYSTNVSVRNVTVKNILLSPLGLMFGGDNVTVDNINVTNSHPRALDVWWDGEKYHYQ